MVCKEDVLLWFKDLESYKRIDVMYELFKMCLPFELRFIGSCVEEFGRLSYQELRGSAINANDLDKLTTKDFTLFNKGLLDDNVRHRLLIYLSLLSSRNYSVANWLYKTVLRTEWFEDFLIKGNLTNDFNLQNEFLLLYVMALHHPAFTFDQKLYFQKILSLLIDIRDNKNCLLSPKLTNVYGYPPGFGYPTVKTMNLPDGTILTPPSSINSCVVGDESFHQQTTSIPSAPPPPSSSSHIQPDYVAWNRPGYPYGAPEVPAFPVTNISPLVSQSTSPIHSRNSSPHRQLIRTAQPPPPPIPVPPLEIIQINPQLTTTIIDPLSPNLYTNEIKMTADDELNNDDNTLQMAWIAPVIYPTTKELKQHNGLRYPTTSTYTNKRQQQRPFIEQFQQLSLDGDIQSNSSSDSSLNQTPPDTPLIVSTTVTTTTTATTVVTSSNQQQQHCPSRGGGGEKTLVNGIPSFVQQQTTMPPPLCDTTSPPPPQLQPNYNNCTVPYTNPPYPTAGTQFTALPARTLFPYPQSYRPPFTTQHFASYQQQQQQQQTNDNSSSFPPPTYTFSPYIVYSSPQQYQQQQQQRSTPCCYNCGSNNHLGLDCTRQNIEDITQKKCYTLEFNTTPPSSSSDNTTFDK